MYDTEGFPDLCAELQEVPYVYDLSPVVHVKEEGDIRLSLLQGSDCQVTAKTGNVVIQTINCDVLTIQAPKGKVCIGTEVKQGKCIGGSLRSVSAQIQAGSDITGGTVAMQNMPSCAARNPLFNGNAEGADFEVLQPSGGNIDFTTVMATNLRINAAKGTVSLGNLYASGFVTATAHQWHITGEEEVKGNESLTLCKAFPSNPLRTVTGIMTLQEQPNCSIAYHGNTHEKGEIVKGAVWHLHDFQPSGKDSFPSLVLHMPNSVRSMTWQGDLTVQGNFWLDAPSTALTIQQKMTVSGTWAAEITALKIATTASIYATSYKIHGQYLDQAGALQGGSLEAILKDHASFLENSSTYIKGAVRFTNEEGQRMQKIQLSSATFKAESGYLAATEIEVTMTRLTKKIIGGVIGSGYRWNECRNYHVVDQTSNPSLVTIYGDLELNVDQMKLSKDVSLTIVGALRNLQQRAANFVIEAEELKEMFYYYYWNRCTECRLPGHYTRFQNLAAHKVGDFTFPACGSDYTNGKIDPRTYNTIAPSIYFGKLEGSFTHVPIIGARPSTPHPSDSTAVTPYTQETLQQFLSEYTEIAARVQSHWSPGNGVYVLLPQGFKGYVKTK